MQKMLSLIIAASAFLAVVQAQVIAQNIDNVVIVLDASGSMNDYMGSVRKIDAAKTAMKEVLKTIPSSTHIGLLVFSASNVRNWAYPLGTRDDQKLNAAIDLPQPSGNTPLGTYMKIGSDRLLEARKAQFGYGTYRLLVVTDGEANSERRDLIDVYTKDIIARGITVDVIGVNMKQSHTLATKVHSYRSANDPAALNKAIREVFAEVSKPRDDMTGDTIFAEIAPLPDGIATAIINTLCSSGNHPIGQQSAKTVTPQAQQQAPQPAQKPASARSSSSAVVWIIIAVVAILVIKGKLKR